MTATSKLQFATTQASLWMSQHPTATRVALIVVPVVAAIAFALATGTSVYACPAVSSGSGGCGM
jgi:hypothetical protein